MSADLVSLPLLHEPKVPLRSACFDSLLLVREHCRSLPRTLHKSLCARAPKGRAINETTAQSRDCAVAT